MVALQLTWHTGQGAGRTTLYRRHANCVIGRCSSAGNGAAGEALSGREDGSIEQGTTAMHRNYRDTILKQWRDEQFAAVSPLEVAEQADRAEALLATVEPTAHYAARDLFVEISGRHELRSVGDRVIAGNNLLHDLRLFIEDATEASGGTAGQRMLTMQQLARRLNVSTKTISRWRKRGLVSRRFMSAGRFRVGFLETSVQRFVSSNAERVRRGSEFSQLTEREKQTILQQARQMANAGCWPAEVTKRLARVTGRNVETIRYTLKHHDQQNPTSAIFPDHHGPMRMETRQRVYQLHRRGESIESLSKRFCRTKASIHRVVLQMRAQRIAELPLDYVPSDEFREDLLSKAERAILAMPAPRVASRSVCLPKGLPAYLASLYEVPLLTREQEMQLFRRMNYLKYKAASLRENLSLERPRSRLMDRIERLHGEAVRTKNRIMRANLRLVVSIAKRHVGPAVSFFELVSDGNVSLIRALEKFDYMRGNKFSTYASWAIMKNFARSIPDELRHIDRFRTGQGDVFVTTEDVRSDQQELETAQTQREAQIGRILKRLGQREQEIIVSRFGLNRNHEPQTLQQVGSAMGVTKERIRQLEARALHKLRMAAAEEKIAFSV